MRVLAFDTATAATVVALTDPEHGLTLEARDDPVPGARPSHARRLLTLIQELLDNSGAGWGAVDRIAVGAGPGTFTGMRIGIATAQALAQATGIPVVGVSTLAALAAGAEAAASRPALAVIDARRGEAFAGGAGLNPSVLTPAELGAAASRLAGGGAPTTPAGATIAVGDGAVRFRETLEHAGLEVPADDSPLHLVSALPHCLLAPTVEPSRSKLVEPQYLRVPDAELTAKR